MNIQILSHAISLTLKDRLGDILSMVTRPGVQALKSKVRKPTSPWITAPLWNKIAVDGAVIQGEGTQAWAKYAIPKGLPTEGKKSLAIENDPHEINDFDGEIASGYGKGMKTLLDSQNVAVKVKGKTFIGKMNYHVHNADRAGTHYDLVVEGILPGTPEWEVNIPSGNYRGRYAFVTTPKGTLIVPMKDRGVVIEKPQYNLKSLDYLEKVVSLNTKGYVIERKIDGSLGNAAIGEYGRVAIRSHRENANTYYDKLPAIEFINNKSRFALLRWIDPYPDLSGTVLRVELYHPDGVSRVSGILNSYPDKAQATQALRGAVKAAAWDIVSIRGRDISTLPYGQRREILEDVINIIRLYNRNWSIVERYTGNDPLSFYNKVINDPRGLPYSEGIIVKPINGIDTPWMKFKHRDFVDLTLVNIVEGTGKYKDSVGTFLVEDPLTGGHGEIGSFAITDAERDWIWKHREEVKGATLKSTVMELTALGKPRAGTFHHWHPDPRLGGIGSEMALQMYADSVSGMNAEESNKALFAIKSAAGWRKS
jgi:hypothetical protein